MYYIWLELTFRKSTVCYKYIQRNAVGKDGGQWDNWQVIKKMTSVMGCNVVSTDHEDAENVNLEDEKFKKDIIELPEEVYQKNFKLNYISILLNTIQ